jgi:hypothetical protein
VADTTSSAPKAIEVGRLARPRCAGRLRCALDG